MGEPSDFIFEADETRRADAGGESEGTGDVFGGGAGTRFSPGDVLAGRYRIVVRIGRGGMGEVYRADDLTLGTSVALKFLPVLYSSDPLSLERLRGEVRLTRQISHRNVCRVYDIAEADGNCFLAMEYVDGEDLSTLLKRIGRMSGDKAVEAARQICAGLAAAHEQGVVHRDLKPANVMLDGRGDARVMDFGLAEVSDDLGPEHARAGTPAYMAPEQLAGREVSQRSDIYALGLVLYEIFTGRKAFEATSLSEFKDLHESSASPATPSDIIDGIDPAAERIIMRCLEHEPEDRPQSALAVLAALPGGDPLDAVMRAGETPSPELVAASGRTAGLPPSRIRALLLVNLIMLPVIVWLSGGHGLERTHGGLNSHEVLAHEAGKILVSLGFERALRDRGGSYSCDMDVYQELMKKAPADRAASMEGDRSPLLFYWYRVSPEPMTSRITTLPGERSIGGALREDDPPLDGPGMALLRLSPSGRLLALDAIPDEPAARPSKERIVPVPEEIVKKLLEAARMDPGAYAPVEPQGLPLREWDRHLAWKRQEAAGEGWPVRLEAAFLHGKPTWVRAWDRELPGIPGRDRSPKSTSDGTWGDVWNLFIIIVGGLLALRNLRSGRGDRKGAARLALMAFAFCAATDYLRAHHSLAFGDEVLRFFASVAYGGVRALMLWLIYLALEPFIRRIHPVSLVTWTRLLGGRWRDPAIGRDLLLGTAVGLAQGLFIVLWAVMGGLRNLPPLLAALGGGIDLLSLPEQLAVVLRTPVLSAAGALGLVFVWVPVHALLGNRRLLSGALYFLLIVIITGWTLPGGWPALVRLVVGLINGMGCFYLIRRHGLLAMVTGLTVQNLVRVVLMTTDPGSWFIANTLATLMLLLVLLAHAVKTAAAGTPLFGAPRSLPDPAR